MSKAAHDIFALVVLSVDWQPKHVTLNFFKASEIIE